VACGAAPAPLSRSSPAGNFVSTRALQPLVALDVEARQKVAESVSADTLPPGLRPAAAEGASLRDVAGRGAPSALYALALALARHRDIVSFARALVRGPRSGERLSRLASVFSFVCHLVDVPPPTDGRARDGVDLLLELAGEEEGPALILAALLLALGERAALSYTPGLAFVRVEIDPADLARLPPHADPILRNGRWYLPLDPRRARSPLGLLPLPARNALRCRPVRRP